MLSITVIAVGKMKDAWMIKGIDEYKKRLGGYCQFSVVELPEYKTPMNPSDAEVVIALTKEGEQILSKVPPRAKAVAMCIEGKMKSSEELACLFEEYSREASHVVFIIGSSHGLSPQVKERADLKFSISPMTFPHQLVRVLLTEQIYRGLSIIAGAKYHK